MKEAGVNDDWRKSDFEAVDDAIRRHNLAKGMDALDVMPRVATWPVWHREMFLAQHKGHIGRWALFIFFAGNGVPPDLAVRLVENEDWDQQRANARGGALAGFVPCRDVKQWYWMQTLVREYKDGKRFEKPRQSAFPLYMSGTDDAWLVVFQKVRGGPFFVKGQATDGSEDRIYKD